MPKLHRCKTWEIMKKSFRIKEQAFLFLFFFKSYIFAEVDGRGRGALEWNSLRPAPGCRATAHLR